MVGHQVGLVEGYNQTAPVRPGWGFGVGPITPHCKDKRDYGYRKLLSCSNIYPSWGKVSDDDDNDKVWNGQIM